MYCQCLDPRDKIYGVLGLLQAQPHDRIVPDYTCTPRELYIQTAISEIVSTGSLDILSLVYGDKTQELDLPSYVPDWTTHLDFSMHAALGIRERNIGSYSASPGSAVDFPNVTRGDSKLTGMLIDTISHIVDEEQLVARLRACQSVAGVDKNNANASPELTAFWHTTCGGLVWAGKSDEYKLRKVCSSDIHQYKRWRATIDSNGCPDLT